MIPTGSGPRFEWRGVMLDVARHFFGVDDVKRFVDVIAGYRLNRLHLHLTDDQGWRLEIRSWPRLAEIGGATAVGGSRGGHYTQQEYADLVAYAEERGVTVVPEIDMPGHVNAALVAYPELGVAGTTPMQYTGTDVGFSSLDVHAEATIQFLEDVIGEVAAITPGAYFHIGGDEAAATARDDYVFLVSRACDIVRAHGKTPVGWEEIARAPLAPGTIVQHWKNARLARAAVRSGARLLMSPARRAYLDQKYDSRTALGLEWAGHIGVHDAYNWDPASLVDASAVVGVEAAIWSETLQTLSDVEWMAFPRLLCIAERAWSRNPPPWDEFRLRLADESAALAERGVNVFRGWE